MTRQTHTIAIDFDGTVVTHDYPRIGKEIGAAPVLRMLTENGHKLILLTMRDHGDVENSWNVDEHDTLDEAIQWFAKNEIKLYGINENPDQNWSNSRKVYADLYIDDAALGVPLRYRKEFSARPFVDWKKIAYMFHEMGLIDSEQLKALGTDILI